MQVAAAPLPLCRTALVRVLHVCRQRRAGRRHAAAGPPAARARAPSGCSRYRCTLEPHDGQPSSCGRPPAETPAAGGPACSPPPNPQPHPRPTCDWCLADPTMASPLSCRLNSAHLSRCCSPLKRANAPLPLRPQYVLAWQGTCTTPKTGVSPCSQQRAAARRQGAGSSWRAGQQCVATKGRAGMAGGQRARRPPAAARC
jgi:hypothetical protein